MRRAFAVLMLLSLPAAVSAQAKGQTKGSLSLGVQKIENNTNSSKFSEYRDLRGDQLPLAFRLRSQTASGWLVDAGGDDVTREDRSLGIQVSKPGRVRFTARWDELPHNLSNKAVSPYTTVAPGKLDVPQTMAIPFKKLATAATDAPGVLRSDSVAASYALTYARPIDLENHTRTGFFEMRYSGVQALDVTASYRLRTKTGSHLSYGPIGDRPPRSLNIQLAEPLDYATGDLTVAADWVQPGYQLRAEYLHSRFENGIDVLEWRNVWASGSGTWDTWDRSIATWGRRPLAPDNTYQSVLVTGGVALPFESRLTATVSRGMMEQDMELLPYAYQVEMLANKTLPRGAADARINTTHLAAEYFIAPVNRVSLRAFYRYFDLENETPTSQWQYAIQDAANLNGTVAYVNKRVSLPVAWDRRNVGGDATFRLGVMRSSLVLGVEREDVTRINRQTSSVAETTLKASWRGRPADWMTVRVSYLRGERDAGEYDWRAWSSSFWYSPAEATTNDDPRHTFVDHPDMRRYDQADRSRQRADATVTVAPAGNWSLSAGVRFRSDDFDSEVTPVQPLADLAVADRLAFTPGDQLGLLRSESRQFSTDLSYAPSDRFGLTLSYGFDLGESNMRSLEYNENNKKNPSAVNTVSLGPWTRASSQWTADFEDLTQYGGFGGTVELVPGKATVNFNYTLSLSDMDIVYGGFGLLEWNGTPLPDNNQFAFRTPPPVTQNTHTANVTVDFPLFGSVDARVGWIFEKYSIKDWQQEAATPWFEPVHSELFLRDTSRSHQWGNRLYNMGSYLAPGFTGHAFHVGLSYTFGGAGR